MQQLILIADDDAKHRKLLTDVLQAEGYTTLTAENGERAIELARSDKPSLILMDIQMPLIDGLSAIRELKADHDTRLIPVIAVTALAMREDWKRMLAAGFDGYLSKPIDIKELRAEVNRHLGGDSHSHDGRGPGGTGPSMAEERRDRTLGGRVPPRPSPDEEAVMRIDGVGNLDINGDTP